MFIQPPYAPSYISNQVDQFFRTIYPQKFMGGAVVLNDSTYHKNSIQRGIDKAISVAVDILRQSREHAAFVSMNLYLPYSDGTCKRRNTRLFGLNHLVFDVDVKCPEEYTHRQISLIEEDLIESLLWEGENGEIPVPNLITTTGSGGIHLYYVFERLPKQMEKSLLALKWAIAEKLVYWERSIGYKYEVPIIVDTGTFDAARMDRIPGSIHAETGRMCICHETPQTRNYSYLELVAAVSGGIRWKGKYVIENAKRHIEKIRKAPSCVSQPVIRYHQKGTPGFLAQKRIRELFALAESGYPFSNCRERAVFLLRIWGMDLSLAKEEVLQLCKKLNGYFHKSLSERELFRVSDPRRHYHFKNQTIREYLYLTKEDGYFLEGKRALHSSSRKEKTLLHKSLIAKLVCSGKKIKEIAIELGISVSIVKRRRTEIKKSEGFSYWLHATPTPP